MSINKPCVIVPTEQVSEYMNDSLKYSSKYTYPRDAAHKTVASIARAADIPLAVALEEYRNLPWYLKEMLNELEYVKRVSENRARDCNRLEAECSDLLSALKETVSCVDDELLACGSDEINQHPTLARHARVSKKTWKLIRNSIPPLKG